jgi:hypothetical protein
MFAFALGWNKSAFAPFVTTNTLSCLASFLTHSASWGVTAITAEAQRNWERINHIKSLAIL